VRIDEQLVNPVLPNLTFVALPIPETIGGTSKNWGVPGFAHAPYSLKFLKGFCLHGPCEYTCQVNRKPDGSAILTRLPKLRRM